jgi:fumarate reductase flavoprotein subunit
VKDANGAPIEGLYAAGNASGNFFAADYPLLLTGASNGRAVTFGRLAGQYAAAA